MQMLVVGLGPVSSVTIAGLVALEANRKQLNFSITVTDLLKIILSGSVKPSCVKLVTLWPEKRGLKI